MVKLGYATVLSPLEVFRLIWFNAYKELCISAGYGILAYVDLTLLLS